MQKRKPRKVETEKRNKKGEGPKKKEIKTTIPPKSKINLSTAKFHHSYPIINEERHSNFQKEEEDVEQEEEQ